MKKLLLTLLLIGLIACLFVGCNVVPPTEGEGEGEGEGEEEVTRVVMVELFSQSGCASCAVVEPILEQLADEYERSEVVLVEERAYGIYSLDEIRDRYEWYLPSVSDRGTPNILFNGLNQKIYGSSTYVAIKGKINLELGKDAKISISATRTNNSTTITISGTIKNIGSSTLDNLVINGMIFKDRGQTGLKYSVTDILEEQKGTVATLEPGSTHNFSFTLEDTNWDVNGLHGVIFVQDIDSSKKEILQAFYVD
jgi:thiol-disulfide isomerase/thioredoxin